MARLLFVTDDGVILSLLECKIESYWGVWDQLIKNTKKATKFLKRNKILCLPEVKKKRRKRDQKYFIDPQGEIVEKPGAGLNWNYHQISVLQYTVCFTAPPALQPRGLAASL